MSWWTYCCLGWASFAFFHVIASVLALSRCRDVLSETVAQHLASLTQNASPSSSCSSGFSLLLQRAESSNESEQAEALGVNKAVDWRLRAHSTASQLQEKRNSPVVLSFLSGYFNFPSSFLWWCDEEKISKCLFPHLERYKRVLLLQQWNAETFFHMKQHNYSWGYPWTQTSWRACFFIKNENTHLFILSLIMFFSLIIAYLPPSLNPTHPHMQ